MVSAAECVPAISSPPVLKHGDDVLVSYGGLYYNAKVTNIKFRANAWRYLVHYTGWSKKFDEWVRSNRIFDEKARGQLKIAPKVKQELGFSDGLNRQEANPSDSLSKVSKVEQSKRCKSRPSVGATAERGKMIKTPKQEFIIESPSDLGKQDAKLLPIQIVLPRTLRRHLQDHKDRIENLQLTRLPKKPSVEDILKLYQDHRMLKRGKAERIDVEVSNGLRYYFDRTLKNLLLYPAERKQYATLLSLNSDIVPSTIYGAEHLLRLFPKLAELLVYDQLKEKEVSELEDKVMEIMLFIEGNESQFLCA
ncbi:protein MRG2 [Selaginella moellendorffii]|uniref:protein MRG2 n=1 Tax=Selaginella moellendorffii TaxID=88036 RepID=UPI000D1C9E07|nr:protein MRG2 [Selaginella moellendorffii]|eukprot:XP_002988173.2 protein MRG2 [Selaginella moellendorffii]